MSPPGDIRAFDVVTGKLVWQFHTVPRPGEFGYETWPKDAYKYVGGANNWGEMSVDEERGIVYLPTGSGTYDFYGGDRHGANLFANCLLALDARTGKRLWHFQTIHHDLWDLDNVSAPQLITVRHNGRRIDAVAHAGKTGFLYVFNRVTGEPLWPIEERPVMQTDVPGEKSWPTQPFPTKPAPFARQSFTVDDVNQWLLKPEEYQAMRARVAKARNGTGPFGGLFVPPAVDQDSISMPGNQGGSNWGTTAANPGEGPRLRAEHGGRRDPETRGREDQDWRIPVRGQSGGCRCRSLREPLRGVPRRQDAEPDSRRAVAHGRDQSAE